MNNSNEPSEDTNPDDLFDQDLVFLNIEDIVEEEPDFVDDEVDYNELNLANFFGEL